MIVTAGNLSDCKEALDLVKNHGTGRSVWPSARSIDMF